MKQILYIVLTAFALQGCLVAKRYEQPEVDVATQYQYASMSDSTSIAALPWRSYFKDKHLQNLVEEGLNSNLDLLIAVQRVEAASAYFKQARVGYLPTVSASATASSVSTSEHGILGAGLDYEQYQLAGQLSWELDLWGKIRSNKRASLANFLATKEGLKATQTQLIASLSTAYIQLLAVDAQLVLMEQTVINRKQSYETMQALKEAGQVNSTAVTSAKAQWLNTQSIQKDVEKVQKILTTTINMMLGKSAGEITRGTLQTNVVANNLKSGYPMSLLSNRPDVKAAELGLRSAFEQTNAARANFYPSLTLSASVGQDATDLGDLLSPEAFFSNLVGGLAAPVFNRRSVRTNYEVSKAKQEEALLVFKKNMIVASKEVSDALVTIETEGEKLKLKQEQQQLLTQTVTESELLLKSGYANYLEVLTARSTELSAQIDIIDAQYNELQARVQLYKALGGGWR